MKHLFGFIILLALSLTACKPKAGDTEGTATDTPTEETSAKQYTLTPFSPSAEYADAEMTSMVYKNGTFNFEYSNYELGIQTPDAPQKMCANSGQGQHIHLIVNTQPYAAKYEGTFPYELEDGDYRILSFLSRSYHESIKNGKAHKAYKVTVANKTFTAQEEITEPMLFYSRPKGDYIGKANTEKVMLDFFLVNADLGNSYKVKAVINNEEHMIDSWQPYYIEGLPMGENRITLTLVDAEGNKVDTPLNPVTRTFTLKADPAETAQ